MFFSYTLSCFPCPETEPQENNQDQKGPRFMFSLYKWESGSLTGWGIWPSPVKWTQNHGKDAWSGALCLMAALRGGESFFEGHTFWLLGNVETHGHLPRSRLSVREVEELMRKSVTSLSQCDTWFKLWLEIDPQVSSLYFFSHLSCWKSIITLNFSEPVSSGDFFQ